MLRYALIAALCASLAATGFFWLWSNARENNARLRADLAAADRVIEVLNDYTVSVQTIEAALTEGLGALADVPDSNTCGLSVDRALDVLRGSRVPHPARSAQP